MGKFANLIAYINNNSNQNPLVIDFATLDSLIVGGLCKTAKNPIRPMYWNPSGRCKWSLPRRIQDYTPFKQRIDVDYVKQTITLR